jgi:hypothetical protein
LGQDNIEKADTGAALKLAPAPAAEEPVSGMKPVFTVSLPVEVSVGDDCKLHLECNVEPTKDASMKIAWSQFIKTFFFVADGRTK